MGKSRYIFLFNLHLTVGIIQIFLYFIKPSFNLALSLNVLTVFLGFFSVLNVSRSFAAPPYSFPHWWFLITISYLFVLVPALHVSESGYTDNLFPGFDWKTNLGKALLVSGIFMNTLLVASLPLFLKHFDKVIEFEFPNIEIKKVTLFLVLLYSVLGFAIWINQVGGLSTLFLTRSSFTGSGLQFQNGYLYASLNFGFGAIIVLLLKGMFSRERMLILVSVVLAGISILPDLIRGTRVNGIFAGVCCVCAYSFYRKSIGKINLFSKFKWIVASLSLPIVIVAPRLYRVQNGISLDSFSQAFEIKNLFDSFAGYDSAMDIGLSIFLKANLDLGYGISYAEALLRPIPRYVWANKPRELDVYLNQVIFPETSSHVGISFSGFSEPLYNFGLIGIVMFALFIGWSSSILLLRSMYGNFYSLLLTVFISAFSFNLLRGNLSTSYSQLAFPLVASIIIVKRHDLYLKKMKP